MLWYSIYTGAKRRHRFTVVIVNFERITTSTGVSTIAFEYAFFSESDIFIFQSLLK